VTVACLSRLRPLGALPLDEVQHHRREQGDELLTSFRGESKTSGRVSLRWTV
jgi:hypothetical protein